MRDNFSDDDRLERGPEMPPLGDKINQNFSSEREAVNTIKRSQFELLSAYLDGEVTAAEKRCVEEWLASDPVVQRLYQRLLNLQGSFPKMPVPAPQMSAEKTAEQIFTKLDRRSHKRLVLWGGGAVAALFMAGLAGIMGEQSLSPQLAQAPAPTKSTVSSDKLMIALNTPVIEIPKASTVANREEPAATRALIVE